MRIDDDIRSQGGLAPTYRLLRRGWSGFNLASAVRRGHLIRVRQGWYSVPETKPILLAAARVGGRLTCTAAAAELGIWTRTINPPVHVAVQANASRLRDPTNHRNRLQLGGEVGLHWDLRPGGSAFVVGPLQALLDMSRCEPLESVVAAADCAIGMGLISRRAWTAAIADRPARLRLILDDVVPKSGSYIESVTRFRLNRVGIRPRSQVRFGQGLRVDFVIGSRLVVEVDGQQHSAPDQYQIDRIRDARLSILGLRSLRFTGHQVLYNWPHVLAAIRSSIRRGDSR